MERNKLPRVLCLSPFFAPLANAEAFCGGKVALQLLDAGIDLNVFAVNYTGHRKFSEDTSRLWSSLGQITTSIPPAAGKSKLLSIPFGLRYQTLEWSRWIGAVVALAQRHHEDHPFDVVYSRGLPNVAHVAGYWIQRAIRRPWVANFNDPWDLEGAHLLPQDRHKRKWTLALQVSNWWLRRVMRTANVLTFPCARLRDYHLRLCRPRGEYHVVPHIGYRSDAVSRSDRFLLVHAGNLGSGESTRRNTTVCLLRGLRDFLDHRPNARSRFSLVLVGPEDHPTLDLAKELHLEANVAWTGRVSYAESLAHIAAATACLLIEGNMPEGIYLPSKFPDYIQAGKPVIALSPATGTIADLLPAVGVTQVPVDDPVAIEAAVARHYDAYMNGGIAALEPVSALRSRYDGVQVAAMLCSLFAKLSAAQPYWE